MKDKNIEKIIADVKKISLTQEEKAVLWSTLDSYTETHQGVHQLKSVRSPYFNFRFAYAIATFLIVILTGGTTAVFASEKALPGDILYPVKIHVSEPLKIAFAGTSEAKQQVKVSQVAERLNETETLAVQGRLSTTTVINMKQAIGIEIGALHGKLSKENQDTLDAIISAHSAIFKSIKGHSNEDQKAHMEDIESAITPAVPENTHVDEDNHGTVLKSDKKKGVDAAEFSSRKDKIKKVIQDVGEKINRNRNADNASVEQDILNTASSSIQNAQDTLNQAEKTYHGDDSDEASTLINASEKSAQAASISVDQGLHLGEIKHDGEDNKK